MLQIADEAFDLALRLRAITILIAGGLQGFIRDSALVWAEEGLEAVRKPEAFVAIAARICPNDVRLTLEQAIPGGMSLEDYSLMREAIAAIREGMPSADQMQPVQYFSMCWGRCTTVPRMLVMHSRLAGGSANGSDCAAHPGSSR